jgi:hypothetical protein
MVQKQKRAASPEFVCALLGIALAFLCMPAQWNNRPTFDYRDFKGLYWLIGGGAVGGLLGPTIAWAKRCSRTW